MGGPAARGLGIAQRLLATLETQAAAAGVQTLRLDTHRSLTEACALYARNGYREIAPYNTNPYAHHWFEKKLPRDSVRCAPRRQNENDPARPPRMLIRRLMGYCRTSGTTVERRPYDSRTRIRGNKYTPGRVKIVD
ncbi:hypothetical protein SODG_006336 [Sodalis praecaptivus]